MSSISLPSNKEDITLEWCSNAFASKLHGKLKQVTPTGQQSAVTGNTAIYAEATLEYEEGTKAASDPASVFIKLGAPNNFAAGGYKREINFYNNLYDQINAVVRLPNVLVANIDETTGQFVLIMENLTAAGCVVGDFLVKKTPLDQTDAMIVAISKIHNIWEGKENPSLPTEFGGWWGQDSNFEQWHQRIQDGMAYWSDTLRGPDKEKSEAVQLSTKFLPSEEAVAKVFENFKNKEFTKKIFDRFWDQPKTLCHGDYRQENAFFKENSAVLVDFQAVHWGPPLKDVAYLVSFAMDWEQIDAGKEKDVVQKYYELRGEDYRKQRTFEQCWQDYTCSRLMVFTQFMWPVKEIYKFAPVPATGTRGWDVLQVMLEKFLLIPAKLDFSFLN